MFKRKTFPITDAGHEAAFNAVYHEHWELLFRLACKKTGSVEDAWDLVHDLFVEIWQNFQAVPIHGPVRAYLVSALYHKVFNYFRAKGLQEKHYKSLESFLAQQYFIDTHVSAKEENEKWARIDQAIADEITHMPGKMKEIVIRNFYQDQKIDQIAGDLSLSKQTIKNQLQIASKRIRVALKRAYAQLLTLV